MFAKICSQISKVHTVSSFSKLSQKLSKPLTSSFLRSTTPSSAQSFRYFSSDKHQNPSPQQIHTDKEFKEALENIDLGGAGGAEDIFKTELQAISIKLLRATTSTEVLGMYEHEIDQGAKLGAEELCLVLYFACYYKTNIVEDPRFLHLVENIFSKLDELSPLYLFTLIHSLGIYSFDFGLNLPVDFQQKLGQLILKNLDSFELNQISATSWSSAQIINAEENSEIKEKVVTGLANILLKNSVSLTGLDYANILSTFSQCGIQNQETLDSFVKSISSNIDKLENEDLNTVTRLVMALGEIQLKDNTVFEDIFTVVLRPQIQNLSVDDAATLIIIYADKLPQKQNFFRELIKNIHVNHSDITITGYLNVWLALAKYRIQAADLEKTLNILKQIPFTNRMWKFRDLEPFELVNIIVAMSTIKLNDKEFLKILTTGLKDRLTDLDNMDLVNLARAFLLYLKQDEDFYLKIHTECCDRFKHLSSQDKNYLKEAFTKAKAYLPASPFIDVTLY